MGIYVKGMEMPKRCSACRFAGYGGRFCELHVCMFTGESLPTLSPDRMDNCPLIPVPPHGRLIDADALAKLEVVPSDNWVFRAIEKAPTIIPASFENLPKSKDSQKIEEGE